MDIILCATQRCGSTLIVEDMRNTGVLGQPEEWFLPWDPSKENDWNKALMGVHKRATGENGVSAVKVMANQLFNIDACLSNTIEPTPSGDFPHFAATFKDAKWVWLRREDIVFQAISRLLAQQTGINHATANAEDEHFAGNLAKGYNTNYNERAEYRYGALLRFATAITIENLAWKRFFSSHGITPLELVYEDVIQDPDIGHLDMLASLIGQTEKPPREPRKMVKLGNKKNENWHNRFFKDAAKNNYMPPNPRARKST